MLKLTEENLQLNFSIRLIVINENFLDYTCKYGCLWWSYEEFKAQKISIEDIGDVEDVWNFTSDCADHVESYLFRFNTINPSSPVLTQGLSSSKDPLKEKSLNNKSNEVSNARSTSNYVEKEAVATASLAVGTLDTEQMVQGAGALSLSQKNRNPPEQKINPFWNRSGIGSFNNPYKNADEKKKLRTGTKGRRVKVLANHFPNLKETNAEKDTLIPTYFFRLFPIISISQKFFSMVLTKVFNSN